ncbi:hypothetical protein DPSP01_008835 [Paraphaeosphaeria sporulosa]
MPKAKRKVVSAGKSAAKGRSVPEDKVVANSESTPKRKSKSKKEIRSKDNPELNITVVIPKTSRRPPFFFWTDPDSEGGFLSPWYTCPFEYGGDRYVSVGQYITVRRAEIYRDRKSLDKILLATSEDEIKALAKNIKDSPISEWVKNRDYLFHINIANRRKFLYSDQSEDLLNRLAKLGDRELVFADPTDPHLGIGLDASEAEKMGRKSWGKNAYGKSFEKLRHKIRNPISPTIPP